jgi:hypothetical protein
MSTSGSTTSTSSKFPGWPASEGIGDPRPSRATRVAPRRARLGPVITEAGRAWPSPSWQATLYKSCNDSVVFRAKYVSHFRERVLRILLMEDPVCAAGLRDGIVSVGAPLGRYVLQADLVSADPCCFYGLDGFVVISVLRAAPKRSAGASSRPRAALCTISSQSQVCRHRRQSATVVTSWYQTTCRQRPREALPPCWCAPR